VKTYYTVMIERLTSGMCRPMTTEMLQGYIGGQVIIKHHSSNDETLGGNIEEITLRAGAVEITCEWLAYRGPKKRKWRPETRREPFLIIFLRGDNTDRGRGILKIRGDNGKMWLFLKGDDDTVERPT